MKSASQMKLNPSLSPDEVGFHHGVISSTAGGFIPPDRTDLVAPTKKDARRRPFFVGAGKGSRTLLSSLGSSRSTDELYPHIKAADISAALIIS